MVLVQYNHSEPERSFNKLSMGILQICFPRFFVPSLFPALLYHTLLFKTKSTRQDQSPKHASLPGNHSSTPLQSSAGPGRERAFGSSTNPLLFPTYTWHPPAMSMGPPAKDGQLLLFPVASRRDILFPISPGHEPAHAWWKNPKIGRAHV